MSDTIYNAQKIATATTTLVHTGQGMTGGIFVLGGTAGTIKIYDGIDATGTLLEDIGSTNTIAFYPFKRGYKLGLTIVTSAATVLTVYWKQA